MGQQAERPRPQGVGLPAAQGDVVHLSSSYLWEAQGVAAGGENDGGTANRVTEADTRFHPVDKGPHAGDRHELSPLDTGPHDGGGHELLPSKQGSEYWP